MMGRRSPLLAGAALPASVSAYGQCVVSAPAVDACRGGVRNAAPSGVTLDLNFMFPGSLDPRITFTRASTATYTDTTGTIQPAAINQPRWDYDPVTHALNGVLLEEPRTNVLLNSAALSTQGVAVTAQSYALSFYGSGTITYSGAAGGSLVGTGSQRVSVVFTPSAGTLTCTVTGSVTSAQLEAGQFPTSYIPVTAAAVTRARDQISMPVGSWFNANQGSLSHEYLMQGTEPTYGCPWWHSSAPTRSRITSISIS